MTADNLLIPWPFCPIVLTFPFGFTQEGFRAFCEAGEINFFPERLPSLGIHPLSHPPEKGGELFFEFFS